MSKKFKCTHCKNTWTLEEGQIEKVIVCPSCGHRFILHSKRKTTLKAEGESETTVHFASKNKIEGEMDMTPMVDVTFLLLIFFMITASFAMQKSLEVPPPDSTEQSAQQKSIEDVENDDDYIIVKVEQDNSIWVDGVEARSYQDLLAKLKEAKSGGKTGAGSDGPGSLLVMADNESDYEYIVQAIDAGNAVGVNKLKLTMVSEE